MVKCASWLTVVRLWPPEGCEIGRNTPVQVFSSAQLMANQTSLHMWDLTYVHQAPKVPSLRNNCILHPSLSLPLFLSQGQGNLVIKLLIKVRLWLQWLSILHWLTKDLITVAKHLVPHFTPTSLSICSATHKHKVLCAKVLIVFLWAEFIMPAKSQLKPSVLSHGSKEQHWRSKTNMLLLKRIDHLKFSVLLQQRNTQNYWVKVKNAKLP